MEVSEPGRQTRIPEEVTWSPLSPRLHPVPARSREGVAARGGGGLLAGRRPCVCQEVPEHVLSQQDLQPDVSRPLTCAGPRSLPLKSV